jgi:predicted RNA binding protein YcfA (HicA-like mRNA interferase family)
MKVREVIALIEADGWARVCTRGSHRQYKHPTRRGRVTVAGHPGDACIRGRCAASCDKRGCRGEKANVLCRGH